MGTSPWAAGLLMDRKIDVDAGDPQGSVKRSLRGGVGRGFDVSFGVEWL